MNILIRTDSSTEIGTGHVMRCLTLADQLTEKGVNVSFVCRELDGHMCSYIESRSYPTFRIKDINQTFDQGKDALEMINKIASIHVDLVIVDHYQIDHKWEKIVQEVVPSIMVIDDLANRYHSCSILLDQNYYQNFKNRYDDLVSSKCIKLLGPSYLLLRPEFYKTVPRKRNGKVKRILIFFGGSDPTNETEKVLIALKKMDISSFLIDVVVGNANPVRESIEKLCLEMGIDYHCQIDYLSELMTKADLALGAGGITMWERCFLGLPSLVTIVADNQRASTQAAGDFGAVWNLGWHETLSEADYLLKMKEVIHSPDKLKNISKKALQLMESDCKGKNRIADTIINYITNN